MRHNFNTDGQGRQWPWLPFPWIRGGLLYVWWRKKRHLFFFSLSLSFNRQNCLQFFSTAQRNNLTEHWKTHKNNVKEHQIHRAYTLLRAQDLPLLSKQVRIHEISRSPSSFLPAEKEVTDRPTARPTDRLTDRPMDRPTDKPTNKNYLWMDIK